MDSYFMGVINKIQAENPELYGLIEGRITKAYFDVQDLGLSETLCEDDIAYRIVNEIFVVAGLIYGLLESELQAKHLNAKLGLD